jgi:hypothetical protein
VPLGIFSSIRSPRARTRQHNISSRMHHHACHVSTCSSAQARTSQVLCACCQDGHTCRWALMSSTGSVMAVCSSFTASSLWPSCTDMREQQKQRNMTGARRPLFMKQRAADMRTTPYRAPHRRRTAPLPPKHTQAKRSQNNHTQQHAGLCQWPGYLHHTSTQCEKRALSSVMRIHAFISAGV